MAIRKRSRATRFLVDLVFERFHACEVCFKSEAFDAIEDVLAPLRLKPLELKRLLRTLTCPGCESRVSPGTFVVTYTPEQLQQARLSKRFDLPDADQLMAFRNSLIKYPMLGAEHPFGRLLSKAMTKAKKTVLEPSEWFRATRKIGKSKFQPRPSHESMKASRHNQIGQAAWYLAGDEKTAAVELIREPKSGLSSGGHTRTGAVIGRGGNRHHVSRVRCKRAGAVGRQPSERSCAER